ncbi:acyl-coenzyme A thioesterase THEM4-like [Protobothrops mucrosquamatus]|uniref:acyl-coenzyme A thioesterase THEM4-like n=1 Tax=Protobothrops mucrosquamatus TaxID=103944 RepID=UPI0010FB9AE5|nr:acyl-coenzyme A thioesterase THEM4-like [Protobothrops mucrosquamatus]
MGVLHHFSHKVQGDSGAWLYAIEKSKDRAVPNPSWSQEMMEQFNRYMEMTKDGSWQKLPSYSSVSDHLSAGLSAPYAHGGAIATILDTTLGASAFHVSQWVMTANLNLNYKSPVALGSVVRVDSRVDKVEGKKIFVSGEMRSVDKQTLYAQATALFIELQPDSFLRKERDPNSSL